jgi:hypothetical protein
MIFDDMARNPMTLVQAIAPPRPPGVVHPTVDGMTPDDPGFRKKIPPPDPMSPVELAAIEEEKRRLGMTASQPAQGSGVATQAPGVVSPSTFRLLVTCSRVDGALVVGLECAPDWDVTETWTMTQESARCVAKVARALGVKIKDMSGGELGVPDVRVPVEYEQTVPNPYSEGSRDLAGDVPDVRGPGPDHASQPMGRPDPSGEGGIRAMDPEQTVEFLEQARRAYEEEIVLRDHEARVDDHPPAGEASDDREDALRRRLGLSTSAVSPGGVWEGPGNPNGPPAGPDPVADGEAPAQPE